jgi:hypothetical protein
MFTVEFSHLKECYWPNNYYINIDYVLTTRSLFSHLEIKMQIYNFTRCFLLV